MDLETILENYAKGKWDFDRTELINALREEEIIPQEHRLQVYQWLLMGDSTPSGIPDTFEEFTKEATEIAAEATAAATEGGGGGAGSGSGHTGQDHTTKLLVECTNELIENSTILKADPSLPCELSGMIFYLCKKTGRQFQKSFLAVIGPLLTLAYSEQGEKAMHVAKLFPLLYSIIGDYLPEVAESTYATATTEVVRLVLQYHDPEVGFHLDRSHVTVGTYVVQWWASMFSTLFASEAVSPDVLSIWDWLFIEGDAVLTAFIPIVFVMEKRRELLSQAGKGEVNGFLRTFSAENIFASPKEVLMKARLIHKNTPFSSRRVLKRLLFPASSSMQLPDPVSFREYFLGFVALPIDASELVDTFSCQDESTGGSGMRPAHLNFVILDCRAEKSFNFARLPTALHVGNDIGFDPKLLDDMVRKFDNARGSHLCILGTGRELEQELNLLKIIVLHFIQAGFKHVGFADGGFKACIPHIKAGKIEVVRSPGAEVPTPSKPTSALAARTAGGGSGSTSPQPPHDEHQTSEKLKAVAAEARASAAKVASGMSGWLKSWSKKDNVESSSVPPGTDSPQPSGGSKTSLAQATKTPSAAGTRSSSQVLAGRDEVGSSSPPSNSPTATPPKAPGTPPPAAASSAAMHAGRSKPTTTTQSLFTLGDGADDSDDDFEFITSVTPVTAEPPSVAAVVAPAPSAPSPSPSMPSARVTTDLESTTPVAPQEEETKVPSQVVVSPSKAEAGAVSTQALAVATTSQPPAATEEEKHPFDDIFV